MISTAEQYIGQSLDALEGACGSPQGSSYEDDLRQVKQDSIITAISQFLQQLMKW